MGSSFFKDMMNGEKQGTAFVSGWSWPDSGFASSS